MENNRFVIKKCAVHGNWICSDLSSKIDVIFNQGRFVATYKVKILDGSFLDEYTPIEQESFLDMIIEHMREYLESNHPKLMFDLPKMPTFTINKEENGDVMKYHKSSTWELKTTLDLSVKSNKKAIINSLKKAIHWLTTTE